MWYYFLFTFSNTKLPQHYSHIIAFLVQLFTSFHVIDKQGRRIPTSPRERGPDSPLFITLLAFPAHCVRGNLYYPHRKPWMPSKKSIGILNTQRNISVDPGPVLDVFSFRDFPIGATLLATVVFRDFLIGATLLGMLFCIGKWVWYCRKVNLCFSLFCFVVYNLRCYLL